MHMTSHADRGMSKARLTALTLALAAVAGCGIDKQSAPELTGPSELALSLTLTATPDTIVQDGESQSVIQVKAHGPDGRPLPGVTVQMSATSSDGAIRAVTFTAPTIVTDANGQATLGMIAPPPPATVPVTPPILFVTATPSGANFTGAVPRQVQVRLLAPAGTPLSNLLPDAVILADPRVANFNETITFDASLTTDEGQACGTRCQYIWEFGDNTVAVKGITASHVYPLPGNYIVTLTVTDDRGGVDTATVDIRIIGPTAPVANFTVTPSTLTVGATGTFNASTSTVGAGATITQYAWDFGDGGATVVTSSATTTKSYTTVGSKLVTLTITDSLGRTATRTSSVTVQ
jgi:PKD repeat protein